MEPSVCGKLITNKTLDTLHPNFSFYSCLHVSANKMPTYGVRQSSCVFQLADYLNKGTSNDRDGGLNTCS